MLAYVAQTTTSLGDEWKLDTEKHVERELHE